MTIFCAEIVLVSVILSWSFQKRKVLIFLASCIPLFDRHTTAKETKF